MRKFILAIAALFSFSSAAYAAFAIFQTYQPETRTQISLTSYGAVCDGVADDTAAFLAFKAANQGSSPIQLNLPAGICTFFPTSGAGQRLFKGVTNLVVNGQGVGSTTLKNTKTDGAQLLMGGDAQQQNNDYSLRTETANAGDSCVTIKTQPAVTVSAIANSLPSSATFTASIGSGIMTVTAVSAGTILPGAFVMAGSAIGGGFSAVQAYGTGGTTGVGGTGTYAMTGSPGTIGSQTFRTVPASFTGTIDANGVMTVSAVADGTLAVGMWVYRQAGSVGHPTSIKSQLTGAAGSTGTYQLSNAPQSALATPSEFIGNGQPRVTVNSTAGLTSGDTLYLTGVTGAGVLPQRVNGLRWIKVVDGTRIDIFQSDFNGSYTSGGTGGGDRTSLTPVGSKVMMTGWNNQSYWASPYSFPSNAHFFEWKTVTSTDSGIHQVCFDAPLTNTYKSTWPQMNTGNQFEVDPGGPATLYKVDDSWDATYVFQNFTLESAFAQSYSQGRSVTFSNVTMTGGLCAVPTQNETYTWTGVDASACDVETDKLIGTWNLTNSSIKDMFIQSSSMDLINIDTVTANRWFGSPKRFVANGLTTTCVSGCSAPNTDTSLSAGTTSYGSVGAASEFTCINCSIASPPGSTAGNGFTYAAARTQVDNPTHPWSMAGGVITIPNGYSWTPTYTDGEIQTRSFVPGGYALWTAGSLVGRAFKVVDATQDLDNIYITTSESGGFPTGAWASGIISVIAHPAPQLTMSGSTGSLSVTSLAGCTPATPLYSCQNITYTGSATGGSVEGFGPTLWGVMDTFTFTNNVPYTGGGALTWTISWASNWPLLKTDLTVVNYGASPNGQAVVNTKLPSSCGSCTRTLIPPATVTNGQASDIITETPTDAWFGGRPNNGPLFSANTPSDNPEVTVTLRTNQNLP